MGNKLLVAVKSCHRDRIEGFHQAIAATWARDFDKDVIVKCFVGVEPNQSRFMGHPSGSAITLASNEVLVDAPDDYMSLPFKTREICRWSLSRMIDHVFLCDCDTFVNAKALRELNYSIFDYAGFFRGGDEEVGRQFEYQDHMGKYPECWSWASGGIGYFLSKRACLEVADTYPRVWAEDMYVGQIMGPHIRRGEILAGALPMKKATQHFLKSEKFPKFTPELLYRAHKEGGFKGIYAS